MNRHSKDFAVQHSHLGAPRRLKPRTNYPTLAIPLPGEGLLARLARLLGLRR